MGKTFVNKNDFYWKCLVAPAVIPFFLMLLVAIPSGLLFLLLLGIFVACGWGGHVIALGFSMPSQNRGDEAEIKRLVRAFPLRAAAAQFVTANIVVNVVELYQRADQHNHFNGSYIVPLILWTGFTLLLSYLYFAIVEAIQNGKNG